MTSVVYANVTAGVVLDSAVVYFTVVNTSYPEVYEFVLVDAATDQDVFWLSNTSVVNLFEHSELSVRVRASVSTVSMTFSINGMPSDDFTDNNVPFTIRGDNNITGDYYSWVPSPGVYTISVRAFDMFGNFSSATVQFEVVNFDLTTGIATTAIATTGSAATTGIASTGVVTTGVASTGVASTGLVTTGLATTSNAQTTGLHTTGNVLTTGIATTGNFATTGTPIRPCGAKPVGVISKCVDGVWVISGDVSVPKNTTLDFNSSVTIEGDVDLDGDIVIGGGGTITIDGDLEGDGTITINSDEDGTGKTVFNISGCAHLENITIDLHVNYEPQDGEEIVIFSFNSNNSPNCSEDDVGDPTLETTTAVESSCNEVTSSNQGTSTKYGVLFHVVDTCDEQTQQSNQLVLIILVYSSVCVCCVVLIAVSALIMWQLANRDRDTKKGLSRARDLQMEVEMVDRQLAAGLSTRMSSSDAALLSTKMSLSNSTNITTNVESDNANSDSDNANQPANNSNSNESE